MSQIKDGNQLKYCYYSDQLNRLKKDGDFAMKVQFTDLDGKQTHFLNLNSESIPIIINYLKSLPC